MPTDRQIHDIEQSDVKGYPGWRLRIGKNIAGENVEIHYISPLGEKWTRAKWREAVNNGEIKRTVETDPTEVTAQREIEKQKAVRASASKEDDTAEWKAVEVNLPDATTKRLPKSSPELASSAELALTATIVLLIVTHIIATFSHVPEAIMTQEEAQGLSVPIGNILATSALNKKYGKYLRDSSDYTLLGYGLYAYISRVASQVRYRREIESSQYGTSTNVSAIASVNRPTTPRRTETSTESARPTGTTGGSASGAENRPLPASGGIAAQTASISINNPIPKQNTQ